MPSDGRCIGINWRQTHGADFLAKVEGRLIGLMFRSFDVSIRWEIFQLYLLLIFVGSWVAMAWSAYKSRNTSGESLRSFLDRYSVRDYVVGTRSVTGRIGIWFWVFVVSLLLFVVASIQVLCGNFTDAGVKLDGDHLWPIL